MRIFFAHTKFFMPNLFSHREIIRLLCLLNTCKAKVNIVVAIVFCDIFCDIFCDSFCDRNCDLGKLKFQVVSFPRMIAIHCQLLESGFLYAFAVLHCYRRVLSKASMISIQHSPFSVHCFSNVACSTVVITAVVVVIVVVVAAVMEVDV
jgi:hypothetical protein